MSKKDYILLARVIKSQVDSASTCVDYQDKEQGEYWTKELAKVLAQTLKLENARFDSERFLTACGITK